MLLIVHRCFLMILSRKIIVRKATLQTTNIFKMVVNILLNGAILNDKLTQYKHKFSTNNLTKPLTMRRKLNRNTMF